MGGGTGEHDTICNNLRAELRERLRGNPCSPQGPDLKVLTGNGRYPDALIDCGKREAGAVTAKAPVAIFGVLSHSTADKDRGEKFDDYDATPGIQHYVLIIQDQVRVEVHARDEQGRLDRDNPTVLRDLGDSIRITSLDVALPLSGIYERIDFGRLP